MPAIAASQYRSGLSDKSLWVTRRPSGVRATMSVKVPPRSIQNCQRFIMLRLSKTDEQVGTCLACFLGCPARHEACSQQSTRWEAGAVPCKRKGARRGIPVHGPPGIRIGELFCRGLQKRPDFLVCEPQGGNLNLQID